MVLDHQHMLGTIRLKEPVTSLDSVRNWFEDLTSALGMSILGGPLVEYCSDEGNEGISGVLLIKTSHISVHFWAEFAKFDCYSCVAFDPDLVLGSLQRFNPIDVNWTVIDRNGF